MHSGEMIIQRTCEETVQIPIVKYSGGNKMFENANNYPFLTVCLTLIVNACLWTFLKVLNNVMYKEVMIIYISIV